MIEHGVNLRCKKSKDPLGTLFYIHGMGESSRCFANLSEHPGLRRWTHLVPDLVGYGDSPHTDEPLTLTEHAARLAKALAAEHPEPVVVLGHSMGGVIGTILTEEVPERVRAFINVEGNISGDDCSYSGIIAAFKEEQWLARGLREFIEKLASDPGLQPRAVIASYLASVERCDPRALYQNACQLKEVSLKGELARRLAALKRPVTFIYGRSGGLSECSLGRLREVGITPRPIADAGHWPFLEQPDRFVATVRAFLDGLGPPRQ